MMGEKNILVHQYLCCFHKSGTIVIAMPHAGKQATFQYSSVSFSEMYFFENINYSWAGQASKNQ